MAYQESLPAPALQTLVAAYWSIVNHVIAPSSASVTFNYLAGDVIGSQGNFAVQTYNGTSWLAPWTTTNPTGTSTTASGVTTFGTFAIGETGQAVVVRAAGPLTFCAGGSVVLQSTVVGAGTYSSYSWYQNSSPVGSSATNYTATTAGQYYLQVKDAAIIYTTPIRCR